MHNCRHEVSLFGLYVNHPQHEWALPHGIAILKPFGCFFKQNGGREWTKSLTHLDASVQYLFRIRLPWITQNASLSERSWTEFRATVKPADYLAFTQQLRRV